MPFNRILHLAKTPVGTTAVTFNPADKASTVTLSNGNLTMLASASAGGGVRSLTSHSTGKYYFEFKLDALGGTGFDGDIGIATAAHTLTGAAYADTSNSAFIRANGGTSSTDLGTSPWGNLVTNDYVGIAFDLDNKRMYGTSSNNDWGSGGAAPWGWCDRHSFASSVGANAFGAGWTISGPFFIFALGIGTTVGGNLLGTTLNTTGPFQTPDAANLVAAGYGNW